MDDSGIADIDQRLRTEQDLPRLILRLRLEGTLPLAAHAELQRRLIDLEAAVFHLDADQTALAVRPTRSDLEFYRLRRRAPPIGRPPQGVGG